jgi:hypothetical protein
VGMLSNQYVGPATLITVTLTRRSRYAGYCGCKRWPVQCPYDENLFCVTADVGGRAV